MARGHLAEQRLDPGRGARIPGEFRQIPARIREGPPTLRHEFEQRIDRVPSLLCRCRTHRGDSTTSLCEGGSWGATDRVATMPTTDFVFFSMGEMAAAVSESARTGA